MKHNTLQKAAHMLANSKGQHLYEHLESVALVSKHLAEKLGLAPSLVEASRLAGLLHDVGKAEGSFQEYLEGKTTGVFRGPYHHEVSWAVLKAGGYRVDTVPPHEQVLVTNLVLNAVYWHHARPLDDKFESRAGTGEVLGTNDFTPVLDLVSSLGVVLDDTLATTEKVPDMYDSGVRDWSLNAKYMAVRGCLVAADRFVSSLTSLSSILAPGYDPSADLSHYMGVVGQVTYTVPSLYDASRFAVQDNCINEALPYRTVQVNAPAGFGKTLQGVLFSLKRGRRVFWVTPRNVIAESVYTNIQRELVALGVSRSVELFLGGERKSCTDHTVPDCFSDIVVTNIDNLTRPMVSNETADKLYLSLASDVVFDEYHEFVSEAPLFAAFIHLMRLRNAVSDCSHTLLLSATPMCLHQLWDMVGRETKVLPDEGKHYPAAHTGLYDLRVSTIRKTPEPGGVVIMNSIKNAQDVKASGHADVLAHSKYIPAHREAVMSFILAKFGKGGKGIAEGVRVSSAPILQAALDISFRWMQESALSAEATVQRIGRVKRWGEFLEVPTVEVLDLGKTDRREQAAVGAIFDSKLKEHWVAHLKGSLTGANVSLQEIYGIYASFYAKHGKDVLEWLSECLRVGTASLNDCCPVKLPDSAKTANSGSGTNLRSVQGSYFYAVQDNNGNYLPPGNELSGLMRDISSLSDRAQRSSSDWVIALGKMVRAGYGSFGRVHSLLKKGRMKKTPDANKHIWCKRREMPYPAPDGFRYDCAGMGGTIGDVGLGLVEG